MPKFLFEAKYTAPEGVRGLMSEGGTSREAAIRDLIAAHGGALEAFYYAFGERDLVAIADLPDAATAAAIAIATSASGLATVSTTPLLTPDDIDAAARIQVNYRGPGQ